MRLCAWAAVAGWCIRMVFVSKSVGDLHRTNTTSCVKGTLEQRTARINSSRKTGQTQNPAEKQNQAFTPLDFYQKFTIIRIDNNQPQIQQDKILD